MGEEFFKHPAVASASSTRLDPDEDRGLGVDRRMEMRRSISTLPYLMTSKLFLMKSFDTEQQLLHL